MASSLKFCRQQSSELSPAYADDLHCSLAGYSRARRENKLKISKTDATARGRYEFIALQLVVRALGLASAGNKNAVVQFDGSSWLRPSARRVLSSSC